MLSQKEKNEIRKDLLDPDKALSVFGWAIARWAEDYHSPREGYLQLTKRVQEKWGVTLSYWTLRRYAMALGGDPLFRTVASVMDVILTEG